MESKDKLKESDINPIQDANTNFSPVISTNVGFRPQDFPTF